MNQSVESDWILSPGCHLKSVQEIYSRIDRLETWFYYRNYSIRFYQLFGSRTAQIPLIQVSSNWENGRIHIYWNSDLLFKQWQNGWGNNRKNWFPCFFLHSPTHSLFLSRPLTLLLYSVQSFSLDTVTQSVHRKELSLNKYVYGKNVGSTFTIRQRVVESEWGSEREVEERAEVTERRRARNESSCHGKWNDDERRRERDKNDEIGVRDDAGIEDGSNVFGNLSPVIFVLIPSLSLSLPLSYFLSLSVHPLPLSNP